MAEGKIQLIVHGVSCRLCQNQEVTSSVGFFSLVSTWEQNPPRS